MTNIIVINCWVKIGMDRILSANISSFSNFLKFYHYNICHFGLAKPN